MATTDKHCFFLWVFCVLLVTSPGGDAVGGEPGIAVTSIPFTGTATGGELTCADTLGRNAACVSILTHKGESAAQVAVRLAEALREAASRDRLAYQGWKLASAREGVLEGLPGSDRMGDYFLAGTETGLGIPKPPSSLTCLYDEQTRRVNVHWVNPPDGYDTIVVLLSWHDYEHSRPNRLAGDASDFVVDPGWDIPHPVEVNDLDVRVVGYRKNVPSNVAAMHVSGHAQEERFGIPFSTGVGPNWSAWSTGVDGKGPHCEQRVREECVHKSDIRHSRVSAPEAKPYVQVIRAQDNRTAGGVCRKFLGLRPGHTYRLWIRANTFEMDKAEGEWSFSFHAVAHGAKTTLTPEQMAGAAALPNDASGSTAGRIVAFGPGNTTKGEFAECSTEKAGAGGTSMDVTMPDRADTITVWFRYQGPPSGSGVGFDWIKLKDLTAK